MVPVVDWTEVWITLAWLAGVIMSIMYVVLMIMVRKDHGSDSILGPSRGISAAEPTMTPHFDHEQRRS